MNKAFRAALGPLFAALLPLAACHPAAEQGPLAGAAIGGPFTLVDQNGATVSDTRFAGQYRLVYFGYSFCPDACPADLQKLMQGYRLLERTQPDKAAKLQPIFITVDPARDTPAALKAFVSAFHPKLIGLTGTEAQIKAVATEYGVYYRKEEPKDGQSQYMVDHSRIATLFGPKGEPIALIAQDGTPEQISAELARWIA